MRHQSPFGATRSLVEADPALPYFFVEHSIPAGHATPYLRAADLHSYVVTGGAVTVDFVENGGDRVQTLVVERLFGWHAPRGSVFRVRAQQRATLVEAGAHAGTEARPTGFPAAAATSTIEAVSRYTVDKPWGHEVWYTENLTEPRYALKQIHMTAGHQSSLQSHREKAETNYVVEGEAVVRNGLPAPDDLTTVIDVERIPLRVHRAGSGWSSAPRILHRVIARTDYTSIEVSTPQLDDVIRWQDDTGRGHGRIAAEHLGAR
ncbi:hypothetical protein [Amycolatopsis sacchari]|uniref:hypothetical protein n=1 Tax=Amycolatopsis sacchari TaxID=115433 RepID=UPI003D73CC34